MNPLNYSITLQEAEGRCQSMIRRPLLSSLVRPSSTVDSFRNLMKMSNRMGSEVVRHFETDSRLMVSE